MKCFARPSSLFQVSLSLLLMARGKGAVQIAAADAYHSLHANSICQGLQIPLQEFRATRFFRSSR
jgi:hypothetical protein